LALNPTAIDQVFPKSRVNDIDYFGVKKRFFIHKKSPGKPGLLNLIFYEMTGVI